MTNDLWYKNAIFYCLSLATYMDAKGDGVGDFEVVVNHTSNEHPWFKEACSDPHSKYRDWYVRSDKKPKDANTGDAGCKLAARAGHLCGGVPFSMRSQGILQLLRPASASILSC